MFEFLVIVASAIPDSDAREVHSSPGTTPVKRQMLVTEISALYGGFFRAGHGHCAGFWGSRRELDINVAGGRAALCDRAALIAF